MELEPILRWMVCFSCLLLLVQAVRVPKGTGGLGLVCGAVLATTGVLMVLAPSTAGYWSAGLFSVVVMGPLVISRRVVTLAHRQDYGGAARLLPFVVPVWGRRRVAQARRRFMALDRLDRDFEGGLDELETLSRDADEDSPSDRLLYLLHSGQWNELLAFSRTSEALRYLDETPIAFAYVLRAYGELGCLDELVKAYERHRATVLYQRSSFHRLYIDGVVLSHLGRPDALERSLFGLPVPLGDEQKDSLRFVAFTRAGRREEAEQVAARLARSSSRILRRRMQAYRAAPFEPVGADTVTPEAQTILRRLETESLLHPPRPQVVMPPATGVIVATLVGVHIWVELFGSTGTRVGDLREFGALVIREHFYALEHRIRPLTILTANYLHLNALHLALNAAGVWIFGRQLEAEIGGRRVFAVFVLSGPLALGTVAATLLLTDGPKGLFVGASGAVMGLVGASLAINLQRYRESKSPFRRRAFVVILVVVAAQTVFDLTHPQVSLGGHLAGVVWGALLAGVWERLRPAADHG